VAEFCRNWRFTNIILESDSLQVVTVIKNYGVSWTMYGQTVEDIKLVLSSCEHQEICHTKQSSN
jgi:hypothetical protein